VRNLDENAKYFGLGLDHELTFTVPMSLSCRPIQNKTAAWAPCNDTGSLSEKYWCARMGTRSRIWNTKHIEIWSNVLDEKTVIFTAQHKNILCKCIKTTYTLSSGLDNCVSYQMIID
jgi:hypothetical protein